VEPSRSEQKGGFFLESVSNDCKTAVYKKIKKKAYETTATSNVLQLRGRLALIVGLVLFRHSIGL